MCKIQNYLIKTTVEKKLMKKRHYLWAYNNIRAFNYLNFECKPNCELSSILKKNPN